MNGKKVLTKCSTIIEDIVLSLGYELVDIDYFKKHSGMVLEVVIYKDGGITLDDCEKVSKALDEPLDNLDPTDGNSYSLNVSSPGLDRPLKKPNDFKRNLNKNIHIKFFAPYNGKKEIDGKLINYSIDNIEILIDDKNERIELNKIAHIVPIIEF